MALKSAPVLDEFTRANGIMGANWTSLSGTLSIESKKVKASTAAAVCKSYWSPSEFPADQEAYATIAALGNEQGVFVRWSNETESGYAVVTEGTQAHLLRVSGFSTTVLFSTPSHIWEAKDVLGLRAEGEKLIVFLQKKGTGAVTVLLELEEAGIATNKGFVGLYFGEAAAGSTGRLDNFGGGGLISVTKPTTQEDEIGVPISELVISAEGATTYEAAALPEGLTINAATGKIKGTPTKVQLTTVMITVKGPGGEASTKFLWEITTTSSPTVTKPADQISTQGGTVSLAISATYTTEYLAAATLPLGLELDQFTGLITGSPTTVEDPTVTIEVRGPGGTKKATTTFKWKIEPEAGPTITKPTDQLSPRDSPAELELEATGAVEYKAAPLPFGMAINKTTGRITGTPKVVETVTVVVQAKGIGGVENSVTFIWKIFEPSGGPDILPSGPEIGVTYVLTGPDGTKAVFNDSTYADYVGVISEATGLDSPEVRESAENLTGMDGGTHGNFYYGRRPITLTGLIFNVTSAKDRNEKLTKLLLASNAMRADAKLEWTPEGGERSYIKVRRAQPVRVSGAWVKDFQLSLIAADPRIYSVEEQENTAVEETTVFCQNNGSHNTLPFVTIKGRPEVMRLENTLTKEALSFNYNPGAAPNNAFIGNIPQPACVVADNNNLQWARSVQGHFGLQSSYKLWVGGYSFATGKYAEEAMNFLPEYNFTETPCAALEGAFMTIGFSYINSSLEKFAKIITLNHIGAVGGSYAPFNWLTLEGATKGAISGIARDSTYWYWADPYNCAIGRKKLSEGSSGTGEPTWKKLAAGKKPNRLVLAGGFLYWGYQGAPNIGVLEIGGAEAKAEAFLATPAEVTGISADEAFIYYAMANSKLGRVTLAGGSQNNEFSTTGIYPSSVSTNSEGIYWTNLSGNSIGRLLKGGPEYEINLDFLNRTIVLNEGQESLYRIVNPASKWWPLEPGVNPIQVTGAAPSAEKVTTTVQWRNAWI